MNKLAKFLETDEKTLQKWARIREAGPLKFVLFFTLALAGFTQLVTWLDPFDDGRRFAVPGWEEALFNVIFVLVIAVAIWFTMESEYGRRSGNGKTGEEGRSG